MGEIVHIEIADNTPESQTIKDVMNLQKVGSQDAIRHILRSYGHDKKPVAQVLGVFNDPDDAKLLDEVVKTAYELRAEEQPRSLEI